MLRAEAIGVLVDIGIGGNEGLRLGQAPRVKNGHTVFSQRMHDEWEHESIGRRWQLADLVAGDPRQDGHASVEWFSDKDKEVSSSHARDHIVDVCVVEAYESLGTLG